MVVKIYLGSLSLDKARAMLQALRVMDAAACNRGLVSATRAVDLVKENQQKLHNLMNGIVSLDIVAIKDSDEHVEVVPEPTSDNMQEDAMEVDSPSSDTEDMDMVEMILKEWSKDEDEELATAARRLLSDDKTLTETRLSVIFEAATRPDTDPSTIVKQVTYAVSMIEEAKCPWLGLLPAMMLLEHRDARVRDSAIFFLQTLGERLRGRSKWSQLSDICNRIGEVKVTAKMGGTFLSSFIATCLKQSQNASALLNLLLELCVHAAASTTSDTKNKSSDAFSRSWVTFSSAKGSCEVASFILDILEQAGEELCPLLVRWSGAGCVLLDGILKHGSPAIPCALLLSLVKMLKGIQAAEPQMIISSGPSGAGGRSRSYSVGKMDGVTIVDSYPEEMTNIVLLALKQSTKSGCHKMIARLVATEILTSTSWRDGVFVNFCPAVKQELASSLFCYAAESSHDEIEEVFMSLPFDAIDLCSMLTQKAMSHASISVTYVSGFVRLHAHQLMTSRQGIELLNTMFDALKASSSRESVEEETSFTQHSLMVAIGQLLVSAQDQGLKMDARSSKSGISVVLALLRGGTANKKESYHMLTKIRSRAAALQILEWYCNLSPTDVVPSLLDVAKASIDLSCGAHNSYTQHARDTLTVITPLIKKFGHVVGLRMESLFSVFISVSVDISEEQQFQLYRDFVHVLHDSDSAGGHYNDVNGLLCVYLSHRAHLSRNDADSSDAVRFITQVLSSTPMTAQVSILFSLLNYGNDIIADLINSAGRPWTLSDREGSVITKEDLEWIAINGAKSTEKDSSRVVKQLDQVVSLAKVLLDTFADCLLLNGVNRFFKKTGDAAELCLQIWQKMLEVHATSRGIYSGDAPGVQHFLVYAMESIDQSRRLIQSMLPVHVFLASVTLIIKEGGTPDVKASALHLVADRVATISHSSPEVLLFADLVEDITSVIGSNNDVNLACSALLALEHICRVVGRSISQKGGASSRHFIHGLTTVGNMLESSVNTKSLDSMTTEKQQLICSLALCAASLVKTIGTASLSSLATIVNSLVLMLHTDADMSEPAVGDVRVLQLSIVRSLGMIIESVPQFLAPYLQKILTEKAIFSKSLRVISLESSNSLKVAIDRFDMILAEAVPARILIPTLCKSVEGCVTSTGVCSVMAILEKALIKALSAEVSAQRNAVLKALTMSCDVTENFSEQECIIKVDERVLVAFVMKLSELQLRRAFTYLREWRGDGTARKFAFWTFSNVLSKKLKTIFLPCLSMAMTDAVGELRHASNAFTRRKTGSEKSGDHKRRRIQSDTEHGYDIDSMRCIQPLLLCLESSLRTDSQVGGNWLRSDEENRYHALLTPLGDLLESKLPDNFPVTSTSISAYQELIYGTDGITGSVVGCLTALASAAGNEQLWKPLNHAVLEACGNEHRAEVRRAGLESLISLMRSLGEEYMVLLPECLPVLSEALEDTNEDNAALAREIIALGEELLGENLMDNMR
jgi:U3 small nucleolar RNA-associated protein 10